MSTRGSFKKGMASSFEDVSSVLLNPGLLINKEVPLDLVRISNIQSNFKSRVGSLKTGEESWHQTP